MYIYYNELSDAREKLLNEITSIDYTDFNKQLTDKEWTIAQICHHLVLTEDVFRGGIERNIQKADVQSFQQRSIQTIRDRKYKIEAPDIVKPTIQDFDIQEIINQLKKVRDKLTSTLSNIQDDSILSRKTIKHPVFKEVTLKQWIEMLYLHELRHIDQIQDIKLRLSSSEQIQ